MPNMEFALADTDLLFLDQLEVTVKPMSAASVQNYSSLLQLHYDFLAT